MISVLGTNIHCLMQHTRTPRKGQFELLCNFCISPWEFPITTANLKGVVKHLQSQYLIQPPIELQISLQMQTGQQIQWPKYAIVDYSNAEADGDFFIGHILHCSRPDFVCLTSLILKLTYISMLDQFNIAGPVHLYAGLILICLRLKLVCWTCLTECWTAHFLSDESDITLDHCIVLAAVWYTVLFRPNYLILPKIDSGPNTSPSGPFSSVVHTFFSLAQLCACWTYTQ